MVCCRIVVSLTSLPCWHQLFAGGCCSGCAVPPRYLSHKSAFTSASTVWDKGSASDPDFTGHLDSQVDLNTLSWEQDLHLYTRPLISMWAFFVCFIGFVHLKLIEFSSMGKETSCNFCKSVGPFQNKSKGLKWKDKQSCFLLYEKSSLILSQAEVLEIALLVMIIKCFMWDIRGNSCCQMDVVAQVPQ